MYFNDLTGKKFGKLLVLELDGRKDKYLTWKCQCDCGNIKSVQGRFLTNGGAISCGCFKPDYEKEKNPNYKHGMENTRLYRIWLGMKCRCKNKNFKRYEGRGISICSAWTEKKTGFINFMNWALANGYEENLSIDRKDNDGNYEPDNCRWATMKEQSNNTSRNVRIEIDEKLYSLEELSNLYNINLHTIKYRYRKGLRGKELIREVDKKRSPLNYIKSENSQLG